MKKILKYLFIVTCSLASVVSCVRFDEQEVLEQNVPEQDSKVKMTFTAQIEGGTDTRTILGGQMGDEYRKVLWLPNDSIGVTNSLWDSYMDKFVNIEEEVSEFSTFEGNTVYSQTYYMFYPYSKDLNPRDGNKIDFEIPTRQTYAKESFASNAMPMVAKGNPYSTIQFYSLCGVLALNITGSETVQSISFTGKNAEGKPISIAGNYYVDMDYEDTPKIYTRDNNNSATVTLNCGDGVALDASTPTPFYIVLPPATYDSFTIMIATTDGKIMIKQSTRPLTIKRVNVTKTGALTYVANETIDLSKLGTANSYIVKETGLYSIDATVIGTGEFGLIDGEPFHTSETTIAPVSAHLVWEDTPGVIGGVTFSNGRINFMSTGTEGNALVAVTDADGKILWSWHIWVTDAPAEQTYVNNTGTYVMLDRNLGAIRADRGTTEEDWKESIGLHYQWGRKDPFAYEKYTSVNTQLSPNETIENPTYFAYGYGQWTKEWTKNFWSTGQKTIYDPCPAGYRVAVPEVWYGFSKTGESANRTQNMNIASSFDHGWYFYIDNNESETAWYPATSFINYWATFESHTNEGSIWSAYNTGQEHSWVLSYRYYSDLDCGLDPYNATVSSVDGRPVRCMKDENATTVVVRIQSVSDVTATSAKVAATVASQGNISVARAGIVCGTSSSVTLDNGTAIDADVTSGEFAITLDNLELLKKYYVKSFAVASDGNTYYSDTKSFITPSDDGIINLSAGGTANCYHIQSPGKYRFDATVRGNSLESVGEIASAEIIWQFENPDDGQQIISEVNFVDGFVEFQAINDAGNALIAVKDANGVILWSWHIWLCDFDPEETAHKYKSGNILMDRNLGATIATFESTEERRRAAGTLYQWGRKDPMTQGTITSSRSEYSTYAESFANPTEIITGAWLASDITDKPETLWSSEQKTAYDPCPPGWTVASKDNWENINCHSPNVALGLMVEYDNNGNSVRYPFGYYYDSNFNYYESDHSYLWTSDYVTGSNCGWTFYYSPGGWYLESGRYQTDAYSVRCMKEEN